MDMYPQCLLLEPEVREWEQRTSAFSFIYYLKFFLRAEMTFFFFFYNRLKKGRRIKNFVFLLDGHDSHGWWVRKIIWWNWFAWEWPFTVCSHCQVGTQSGHKGVLSTFGQKTAGGDGYSRGWEPGKAGGHLWNGLDSGWWEPKRWHFHGPQRCLAGCRGQGNKEYPA